MQSLSERLPSSMPLSIPFAALLGAEIDGAAFPVQRYRVTRGHIHTTDRVPYHIISIQSATGISAVRIATRRSQNPDDPRNHLDSYVQKQAEKNDSDQYHVILGARLPRAL
jgi:hypothetical protein